VISNEIIRIKMIPCRSSRYFEETRYRWK